MHSHIWGRHRAKFDDDDFNSFRGIACEGHKHTHRHRHSLGWTALKFALQTKSMWTCRNAQLWKWCFVILCHAQNKFQDRVNCTPHWLGVQHVRTSNCYALCPFTRTASVKKGKEKNALGLNKAIFCRSRELSLLCLGKENCKIRSSWRTEDSNKQVQ